MYEQLGIEWLSPQAASVVLGVLLGIAFGAVGLRSRFCLRRALVADDSSDRKDAAAVWITALGAALVGTQLSVLAGWIDFSEHRFHVAELPFVLVACGGLLFGAGMVLTRGCASRMSVLAGSGNIRALLVLLVFAVTAHATLKGVLSPIRTSLADFTIDIGQYATPVSSSAAIAAIVFIVVVAIAVLVVKSQTPRMQLVAGVLIGLLVPLGWVGTGWVLQDEFDPIVFQSIAFTSASSEWLFWSIASTSISAGFGVGFLSGVLGGSAVTAMFTREFKWVSFTSPAQTGRYIFGAILMGLGGTLAGGCTVGAGLSGVSSLSLSAALALLFIALGALMTAAVLRQRSAVVVPAG